MSKILYYENLFIIKGNNQHTGLKTDLTITGKDRNYWNVES